MQAGAALIGEKLGRALELAPGGSPSALPESDVGRSRLFLGPRPWRLN